MSRKIPVLEIFAPDSAKNCKKSQPKLHDFEVVDLDEKRLSMYYMMSHVYPNVPGHAHVWAK